ncbi:MAG: VacJ family lipoprotein [Paracoccaceae bacterium]
MKLAAVLACSAVVAACSPAPIPTEIEDPNEEQNRKMHELNIGIDRVIVRPTANTYGTIVPEPVRTVVGNVASNLNEPGHVLNNLLQGRLERAGSNTFRFLVNTTFGIGGIMDVATEAGLPHDPTDFGETLHVWGQPEGEYIELPVVGPSTSRHAFGRIVDTVIYPLNVVLKGQDRTAAMATGVAARFGDRYRYSDLVDSILYESEDGYAQARLLYLQNRRFKLAGDQEPEYFDPYEDIYGED